MSVVESYRSPAKGQALFRIFLIGRSEALEALF
jgi:hypothetical protein